MNNLEAALKYRFEYNWSVIPLSPNSKVPPKGFEVIPFRTRLASEDEIKAWWSENPNYNIGIITGKLSNLLVVDHDKYKPEYSEDEALKYIPDSVITPTTKSPQGGDHQYFIYPDENITIGAALLPGMDYRGEGGYIVAPPSINGNGKSYEWVISPKDTEFANAPSQVIDLLKSSSSISSNLLYTQGLTNNILKDVKDVKTCYIFSHSGSRDQDIFHVANTLKKGGASNDELHIILNILAEHCDPPFPRSEVELKISSAIDRVSRKTRNISEEVKDWSLLNEGVFLLKDCYNELKLVKSEDQLTARVVLSKLVKDGSIEKHGNMRGQYRSKTTDAPEIDIFSATLDEYDIKFPMGIHEWVKIHKSNIVLIAGESNAGKTALCLNVAKLNPNKKVNYLSSEMQDGTELRIRLDAFNEPLEKWKDVKFRFRTDNFPDMIDPNGLNIVDYLDEGSDGEAYKMTRRIKDISEKLQDGIAVVCIQKSSQKQFGFGGEGTKNAARLYLTITQQNRITIEKGKVWRNATINPNGLFCDFKLVAGCKFKREGDWSS